MDSPPQNGENLCRYFWKLVGLSLIFGIVGFVSIVNLVIWLILVLLLNLLGFKLVKNKSIPETFRDVKLSLSFFTVRGVRIYPVFGWLAVASGALAAWLTGKYGISWVVWGTIALGALMVLWALVGFFRQLSGLQIKINKETDEHGLTYFYIGKYKIYPLIICLTLGIAGLLISAMMAWGELGLIQLLISLICLPLIYKFLKNFDEWDQRVSEVRKPVLPSEIREKRPNETLRLIKAYFKAKKDKVCPFITFKD